MAVIELRGDEIPVSDTMRSQAFYLLRRYSSLTYIERMKDIFFAFISFYQELSMADPDEPTGWWRQNVTAFLADTLEQNKGIWMIRQGDLGGHKYVAQGLKFVDFLDSQRFTDYGYRRAFRDNSHLLELAERAVSMAIRVGFTILDGWGWSRIIDPMFGPFHFPYRLETMPEPQDIEVLYQEGIPISGIWMPTSILNGCPQYLWRGRRAPTGKRLAKMVEDPSIGGKPPRRRFYYLDETTRWRLLWADDRYRGGKVPDESAYLDESTSMPVRKNPNLCEEGARI